MCGTDTAGRGAFESPPEDGARTKLLDREFQFRESHTEAEAKKTPDRIPEKKNDRTYIYLFMAAPGALMSFLVWSRPETAMGILYKLSPGWLTAPSKEWVCVKTLALPCMAMACHTHRLSHPGNADTGHVGFVPTRPTLPA